MAERRLAVSLSDVRKKEEAAEEAGAWRAELCLFNLS